MSSRNNTNVYADPGYPDAAEMLAKAKLVSRISEIVRAKGSTLHELAKLFGMTQSKVSALLRGQFRSVTESKLIECLTNLGGDVKEHERHRLRRQLLAGTASEPGAQADVGYFEHLRRRVHRRPKSRTRA